MDALQETKAPLMYISNLVTQPGETDGYTVSAHVDVLNRYLRGRSIDAVIANSGKVDDLIRRTIHLQLSAVRRQISINTYLRTDSVLHSFNRNATASGSSGRFMFDSVVRRSV